jgi:hypothetical protein
LFRYKNLIFIPRSSSIAPVSIGTFFDSSQFLVNGVFATINRLFDAMNFIPPDWMERYQYWIKQYWNLRYLKEKQGVIRVVLMHCIAIPLQ